MAVTSIDLDDTLIARAMDLYGLRTKREAVDYALRQLVGDARPRDALELRGHGWEGDLAELRGGSLE